MPTPSPFRKNIAAFVALAMLGSSAMAAAPPRMVDPLVVVSVFGTADSRAAVCAAGASAAAAAGTAAATASQAPATGCVLPVVDAAPAVETAPPVAIAPSAATGVGALPLLLGLAAIVGIAAVVLGSTDENGEIVLPISP